MCIPIQNGRNLARKTAVFQHCVHSGVRPQARISTTFFRTDPDDEARHDIWSIIGDFIYRIHSIFHPIPVNYIDVQRQTKTSTDVLQEATIGDFWIIHGDKVTV